MCGFGCPVDFSVQSVELMCLTPRTCSHCIMCMICITVCTRLIRVDTTYFVTPEYSSVRAAETTAEVGVHLSWYSRVDLLTQVMH
jgi:hypothetical protein